MVSHPPRLDSFDYIGKHCYFLTFCTFRRCAVFERPGNGELLRAQLLRSSLEYDMAVHVYCAMPDHVHLLARGSSDYSALRSFMSHLKQHTGWQYRKATGGRLWQGSYYDHVVRPEEGTAGIVAYIVNNPVRAQLVRKPEDYPYWDSFTQTREGLLAYIQGAGEWKPPISVSP